MENKFLKKSLHTVLCLAFWLVFWQVFSMVLGRPTVLPTPFSVFGTLTQLLGTMDFFRACLMSLMRIFAGLFLGLAAGALLGVFCAFVDLLDGIFSPAVSVIKATPIASIIILMLFVLEKSYVPMIASMLMVVPIVYTNVRKGISAVPTEQREVAQVYGFGFAKRMKYCVLPSVVPYFSAACRSSLGLAWKAGIAAEVICTPKHSIGQNLYNSKMYLESEELFAWTIVVIVMSILIEKGVLYLLEKLVKKGGVSGASLGED